VSRSVMDWRTVLQRRPVGNIPAFASHRPCHRAVIAASQVVVALKSYLGACGSDPPRLDAGRKR
jgi:hypothetical protein